MTTLRKALALARNNGYIATRNRKSGSWFLRNSNGEAIAALSRRNGYVTGIWEKGAYKEKDWDVFAAELIETVQQ